MASRCIRNSAQRVDPGRCGFLAAKSNSATPVGRTGASAGGASQALGAARARSDDAVSSECRRIACDSRRSTQRSTRTPAASSPGYQAVVSSHTHRGCCASSPATAAARPVCGSLVGSALCAPSLRQRRDRASVVVGGQGEVHCSSLPCACDSPLPSSRSLPNPEIRAGPAGLHGNARHATRRFLHFGQSRQIRPSVRPGSQVRPIRRPSIRPVLQLVGKPARPASPSPEFPSEQTRMHSRTATQAEAPETGSGRDGYDAGGRATGQWSRVPSLASTFFSPASMATAKRFCLGGIGQLNA